jgi:NADH-quinone oxidoreductase subunit H
MYFTFTLFHFWITLVLIAAAVGVVMGTVTYLTLLERKIAAWSSDRIGPNRVGRDFYLPWGLLQPIADGLKFLFKEQVVPSHVDRLFYFLGPCIAVATALFAFAVIPFGRTGGLKDSSSAPPVLLDHRQDPAMPVWPQTEAELTAVLDADRAWAEAHNEKPFKERLKDYNDTTQFVIAPHVDIGLIFVFAVGSLGVYAVVLGGWSSNNKYSLLGALRSSAQLISYEIPMGMSVLGVFLLAGSLNLETIIDQQAEHGWNIIFQPLACLLFVASIFAECNRVPFDLPEAEQELVAGYHTEYSGMKFALFMLGEYAHMIATSFLAVTVFFGGWHLPWIATAEVGGIGDLIVKLIVFAGKMVLFIGLYMFIRWTIPRFRFDQLMGLAWKVMMPLALINLVAVLLMKHYRPLVIDGRDYSHWLLLPISLIILIGATVLALRMPPPPPRGKVVIRGHPVTGSSQVVAP